MSIYNLTTFTEVSMVGTNDVKNYVTALTSLTPSEAQLEQLYAAVDFPLLQDLRNVSAWCSAELSCFNQDAAIQTRLTSVDSSISSINDTIRSIMGV